MPETVKEPYERALSPKVKLFFGYKDGRAELKVTTPIGIVIPVSISITQISLIKRVFDRFYGWAKKTDEERLGGLGDAEEVLDDRCKARGEFPDGHVDLSVRPVKIAPWVSIGLSREEVLTGKPVMDEVNLWASLPEDVREFQGAA